MLFSIQKYKIWSIMKTATKILTHLNNVINTSENIHGEKYNNMVLKLTMGVYLRVTES